MKTLSVKQLGKAKVIVDIVPKGNPEIRPAYSMKPKFITIHNTGNAGRGANAVAHNKYIHNMAKLQPKDTGYASWHFSVDENYIYQHIPLDETAWHTGDGSGKASGNMTSIGIEICEHVDQKDYKQAEENAIALTVHLLKQLNLPVANVKPHQAWSGKYCPRVILKRDGSFTPFHNRIKEAYKGLTSTSNSVPTTTPTQPPKENDVMSMKMIDMEGINKSNVKQLATVYKEAYAEGFLTDTRWAERAEKEVITVGEVAFLATILDHRRHRDYCKKQVK